MVMQQSQVISIEIGGTEVTDDSFLLQSSKLLHGINPARVLKCPPVKLHEIDL
jgi:hypothetical protein